MRCPYTSNAILIGQVVVNCVSFFNDLILVKYFYRNPRFHETLSRRIPAPDR